MPFIINFEQVEKAFNEYSGVQVSFNLDNIYKVWDVLCQFNSSGLLIFDATTIDNIINNAQSVTRGIITFFINIGVLEDINKETRPFKTEITFKGSFWLKIIGTSEIKLSIFLNNRIREWETVKLILSYLQTKLPEGASFKDIENQLGNQMEEFWHIYPRFPAGRNVQTPPRKPFNRVVLKGLLELLGDLLIIQIKEVKGLTKYLGPLI